MKRIFLLLIACYIPVICAYDGYAPNIRLNSELDAFLLRLSSRYDVSLPASWFCRPIHTADLFSFLSSIDSLDSAGTLSPRESFRLKRVKQRFGLQSGIYRWKNEEKETATLIHLSLTGDIQPRYSDGKGAAVLKGIINPSFTGSIGKLSFFSGVDVWTVYSSDTLYRKSSYQPYNGIPYNLFGRDTRKSKTRASDILRGGIGYRWDRIEVQTAVDYIRQGPAIFYPLTFSGYTPPLTYLRARLDLWKADYFHTFGLLKSQKDKRKYFYTHRLQIPLFRNRLIAGINETVINGSTTDEENDSLQLNYYGEERGFEWVYMIPFIPYAFAEHYNGDRDNATMSFDLCLNYPRNFRWYGEFFIDDISAPWTLFSDDFGNKWGLTAGAQMFTVLFQKDITATVEYSRIEPWVYTHFYGGSHRYTHFGQSLGSPLGPNSAALVVQIESEISPLNTVGIRFRNRRKNSSARGGSIKHIFQDSSYTFNDTTLYPSQPDSERKEFLGSQTVSSNRLGLVWKFSPFGIFHVSAVVEYDFSSHNEGVFAHIDGGFVF
ncbi:MAG: hypothetical protein GF401_17070 [Chitinivibrionales bacterium]|nr:hypothetical protein [Chitinivibrionales bacterium]